MLPIGGGKATRLVICRLEGYERRGVGAEKQRRRCDGVVGWKGMGLPVNATGELGACIQTHGLYHLGFICTHITMTSEGARHPYTTAR